jgi:hypothetical protein
LLVLDSRQVQTVAPQFPDALYRITSGDARREAIFEDDQGPEAFLGVLAEVVQGYRRTGGAFCLTDTPAAISM